MEFSTKAIRVGQEPDAAYGAAIPPIYQTATFVWKSLDEFPKFDYSRVWNPTRETLEKVIASLEGAEYCLYVASGMAAVATALSLLEAGDHLIVARDIYGGTHRIAHQILNRHGIEIGEFDPCDPDTLDRAVQPNSKMVVFEGPSNPILRIPNIRLIADKARKAGMLSVFDNTFASPYLQNPLEFGIDIVVHSTTKYINGHSDVVGGAVLTNSPQFYDRFFFFSKAFGLPPSPIDCWLTLRGVKTLAVRMRQHCENAQRVASFLQGHPGVSRVYYPGLPCHSDHHLAKRQMKDFGGMVSFELKGSVEQAKRFAESTKIFLLAESLGGVESLLGYPWLMSHGCMSDEDKLSKGIIPTLLRLSVGIEDSKDQIADLEQAFER